MAEPEDEEVAGGGAAAEHGGDGVQFVAGYAAGGGGVERSAEKITDEDVKEEPEKCKKEEKGKK